MAARDLQEMLRHAANNGVHVLPAAGRAAIERAAGAAGLAFHFVQLDDTDDDADALALIGEAMGFPEWYGGNLDALYDCLTDLSWQETGATAIVLTGCDALKESAPERWAMLLSVFAAAAEYWQDAETPFSVFIDMRVEGLAEPPSGG